MNSLRSRGTLDVRVFAASPAGRPSLSPRTAVAEDRTVLPRNQTTRVISRARNSRGLRVRRAKGGRESFHPTHRIAALGSLAYDLTAGHKTTSLHPFTGARPLRGRPAGRADRAREPIDESSPVTCFIEDARDGLYHLCYEADDLDATISISESTTAFPSHRPLPRSPLAGVVSSS